MMKALVVVLDAMDATQFVRCLTQVCGTVPEQTEVVAVSSRFPRLPSFLPSFLTERVEQVRLSHEDEVAVALDDLVTAQAPTTSVLAVSSRASLRRGWYESALEAGQRVPQNVGVLGVGSPRLLRVLPGGTPPSRLTTYPLAGIVGVREERPRLAVPAARAAQASAPVDFPSAAHRY